jgi:hypothetical protein
MRVSLLSAAVLATACADVNLERVEGGVDADPQRALAPLGLLAPRFDRPWEKALSADAPRGRQEAPPEQGDETNQPGDNTGNQPGPDGTGNTEPEGGTDGGSEEPNQQPGNGSESPETQPEEGSETPESQPHEGPDNTHHQPDRTHPGSPLALVVVLEISPDMAKHRESLRAAASAAARAVGAEQNPRDQVLVLAHVDRRVHVLADPASGLARLHELSTMADTCSTLLDPTWTEYQNPVVTSPPCWSDESGADISTALWVARTWMVTTAPVDAVRGVIWVGGGRVSELSEIGLRPEAMEGQWPATILHPRGLDEPLLMEAARSESGALAAEDASIFAFGLGSAADPQLLDEVAQGAGFGEVLAGPSAVEAEVQRAVFLLRDR